MPVNFLNTIANLYANRNFASAFVQGQFSLLNRTFATITSGISDLIKTGVDLRLKTQFQIVGRRKKVMVDNTANDFSGYNKKFVNDQGMYMPDAAISEFASTDFGKRVVTKDIEAKLASIVQRDSHTSFIYNMLISWGRAVLYKHNNNIVRDEDGFHVLRVKHNCYKDRHYMMAGYLPDEHIVEVVLEPPIDMAGHLPAIRTAENYFNHNYVLHYEASTPEKETFYLSHAKGRTYTSELNFDIPIPEFNLTDMVLDRVNPYSNAIRFSENYEHYGNPDMLWAWIMDYVKINRLEEQFASAMELFGSMSFHPDPSTQEATVWLHSELVAVISPFSPTRARLRVNLTEEPYNPNPETTTYMFDSSMHASNFFIDSAIYNYLMWYGLYAILHDEARCRNDWRTVFTSVADHLQALLTPEMRAFCIANITGQNVPTFMTTGCGFMVNLAPMEEVDAVGVVQTFDHSPRLYNLPISAIYAPVSGSLLLGALAGDLEVVQHLKSVYQFTGAGFGDNQYPAEELLKLATIYRLAGNEISLRNLRTDQRKTPYANVNECIIEPASIFFDPLDRDVWVPHSSDPRPGRSFPLPEVNNVILGSRVSISIQRPTIEPIVYRSATQTLRAFVQPAVSARRKLVGTVTSKYNVSPITFKARPMPEFQRQDFRSALTQQPPSRPEGPKVEEVQQLLHPVPPAAVPPDIPNVANAESNVPSGQSESERHLAPTGPGDSTNLAQIT